MPKVQKSGDEPKYEKYDYYTKIFIYNDPLWNNLHPLVEVIRNLEKYAILCYKYGKGQQNIKNYGSYYGHRILGYDLNNKDDYSSVFRKTMIEFLFLLSDNLEDNVANNLIKVSKESNISVIHYKENKYYFDAQYYVGNTLVAKEYVFENPLDVCSKIKEISDLESVNEFAKTFSDFELIPETEKPIVEKPVIEKCLEILKQPKLYDPTGTVKNLKKAEYYRLKNTPLKLDDDIVTKFKNIKILKK